MLYMGDILKKVHPDRQKSFFEKLKDRRRDVEGLILGLYEARLDIEYPRTIIVRESLADIPQDIRFKFSTLVLALGGTTTHNFDLQNAALVIAYRGRIRHVVSCGVIWGDYSVDSPELVFQSTPARR